MLSKFSFAEIKDAFVGLPTWVLVLMCIIVFMGVVGQWTLYAKCDLPGYSAVVPGWNVVIFLQIVGRPSKQSWIVMLPPLIMFLVFYFVDNLMLCCIISGIVFIPWAIYLIRVYIEVCKCFGKNNVASYILIVLFNGLYLFNLALSQEEKYYGPIYKEGNPAPKF